MFERFTTQARAVVVRAQHRARDEDAPEIDATHLVHALLEPETGEPTGATLVLARAGVAPQRVFADLDRVRRRGGLSAADAEALAGLGIDVEQIVDRVEHSHGKYALAGSRGLFRPKRRGFLIRHHKPFAREAKQLLTRSLREALDRGDNHIGTEHLLLAAAGQPGPVADVLAGVGLDHVTVRRTLTARREAS